MSRRALVGLLALCTLVLAAATAPAEAQIQSQRVASGLTRPVFGTAPAGDPDRLFVLEKVGRIRIIENGVLQATPFLNIVGEVLSSGNEQGLLGMAFHPDYANNGYFFVYHTAGSGAGNSVIRRYQVTSNPDTADAASRFDILSFPQPQTNHNGGTIAFGPDGFLYLGLGDGGGANDTNDRAQNGLLPLGKLLRIDIDNDDFPGDPEKNYAIPLDNPYRTDPGFLNEIWSFGWRNPYRFSFDSATGDIYVADVGQNCWEEIDFQPASSIGRENWGWNLMEGTHCFSKTNPFNCDPGGCNPAALRLPIHEYQHGGGRCSVSGGFVYRGQDIPAIDGLYFFADYCSRQIWSFRYDGTNLTEFQDRSAELDPIDGTTIGNITGFGQDGRGELYITDDSGQVFKILPDPVGVNPDPQTSRFFGMTGGVPNPFLTATHFEIRLERATSLEVAVYDAAGRRVRTLQDQPRVQGLVPVVWDGRDAEDRPAPAGVYFVRATSEDGAVTRRVTLLR